MLRRLLTAAVLAAAVVATAINLPGDGEGAGDRDGDLATLYNQARAMKGLPHAKRPGPPRPRRVRRRRHQERDLPGGQLLEGDPGPDVRRRATRQLGVRRPGAQARRPGAHDGAVQLPRTRPPDDPLRDGQRLLHARGGRPLRRHGAVVLQAHRPRHLPALRHRPRLPRRRRRKRRLRRRAQCGHRVDRGAVRFRLHPPHRRRPLPLRRRRPARHRRHGHAVHPRRHHRLHLLPRGRRSTSPAPRRPGSRRTRRSAGTSTRTPTAWPSSSSAAACTAAAPGTSTARRTPCRTAPTTPPPVATAPPWRRCSRADPPTTRSAGRRSRTGRRRSR